jgi:sugar O-acyltransferase (sialic acid O-acetyltransferase NeuD family)
MLLYGNGGHAKVITDCLKSVGIAVSGIFDDNLNLPENHLALGVYDATKQADQPLIIAIGNNQTRKKISQQITHTFGKAVHTSSSVSETASIGEGTVIFHQVIVQAATTIGKHVILNTRSIVEHDCQVADFVHIAPNVTVCGGVKIGEGTLIGASATILPNLSIGKWAVIGAGITITKDVPDFTVIKDNEPENNPTYSEKEQIYLSPPHLSGSEIGYIKKAIATNWVSTVGENITDFEQEICRFTGSKFAVALNSGTAAIHLALILAGVQAGDEVICPSFTFAATANPILYQKATPVFIDSEAQTWNICPDLLRKAIAGHISKGKKPKAIMVVHLYGQPALMKELLEISEETGIPLIEDAAEALGSVYEGQKAGTFGQYGILSFNGNKIITTSGGGILLTDNEVIAKKALFLATQARDSAPHYQHSAIGYNYRMSNISAGIGLGQMEVLTRRVEEKRKINAFYKNAFAGITEISFQPEIENSFSNKWLTTILIDPKSGVSPEKVRLALANHHVEARPLWKPLHLQPVFKEYPFYTANHLSETFFNQGICLPSGTQLCENQLDRIVEIIKSVFKK